MSNEHETSKSYNIKNSYNITYLLLALPLIIVVPIMLILSDDYLMALVFVIYLLLILVCLSDIRRNIYFLIFLLSFFIFLISGDLFEQIFHKYYYYIRFNPDETFHARLSIITSLVFILLGFVIPNSRKLSEKQSFLEHSLSQIDIYILSLRQASSSVFYLTIGILIFDTINKVFFVQANGYIAYYTSYDAILPLLIRKVGDFSPITLCVFLATFPSKKKSFPIIFLYFLYSIIGLFVGQRGNFVYNALFLFGYCVYRNEDYSDGEIWITKRMIILLILTTPLLLVFFQIFGYIRLGIEVVYTSFFDSLLSFFTNIGASSKVIKYGYIYKDQLVDFRFYSLGELLNYLKYGKLFNLFNNNDIPSPHTIRYAIEGHSFASIISFLSMPDRYFNGEGTGSSFIAELYADFGYLGIAVGSFVYGLVFKSISSLNRNEWLKTTIKLYMMLNLINVPRGSFGSFLAVIININFVFILTCIYLLANTIYNSNIPIHEYDLRP